MAERRCGINNQFYYDVSQDGYGWIRIGRPFWVQSSKCWEGRPKCYLQGTHRDVSVPSHVWWEERRVRLQGIQLQGLGISRQAAPRKGKAHAKSQRGNICRIHRKYERVGILHSGGSENNELQSSQVFWTWISVPEQEDDWSIPVRQFN